MLWVFCKTMKTPAQFITLVNDSKDIIEKLTKYCGEIHTKFVNYVLFIVNVSWYKICISIRRHLHTKTVFLH